MKKFTLLVCLLSFSISNSHAQLDKFAKSLDKLSKKNQFFFGYENEMYDTLIVDIDWSKASLKEALRAYRSVFRESYGEAINGCNKKNCLWESYINGVQLLIYNDLKTDVSDEEMFLGLTEFFDEELVYLKEQGIDILKTVATPYQPKQKLFFSLFEVSLSQEALGYFNESGLAFAKALLNAGITFDTKTKARGWPKDATLLDHFMIRVYGLAPFQFYDSYPEPPSIDLLYDQFFSGTDINEFRWRGHNWFSAPLALSSDFIPLIYFELLERGYDLTRVCDTYCEGQNGLMLLASSNLWDFDWTALIGWLDADAVKSKKILNTQDLNGNTALMLAAQNGNTGLFEQLLSMGADISIQNKTGKNVEQLLNELILLEKDAENSSLLGSGGDVLSLNETMLKALKEKK